METVVWVEVDGVGHARVAGRVLCGVKADGAPKLTINAGAEWVRGKCFFRGARLCRACIDRNLKRWCGKSP